MWPRHSCVCAADALRPSGERESARAWGWGLVFLSSWIGRLAAHKGRRTATCAHTPVPEPLLAPSALADGGRGRERGNEASSLSLLTECIVLLCVFVCMPSTRALRLR